MSCERMIGPYKCCSVVQGDNVELMRELPDKSVDVVFADPPYGVQKAEWDSVFSMDWADGIDRIAWKLALMPGTWNLLSCPTRIGHLRYRWTLAAHLTNGMTRGRMGFGNWIPCVVYGVEYSHTPYRQEVLNWCCNFGDWCRANKIRNADLDAACGTLSMGDWWTGRSLPWCRMPKREHWASIKGALNPPASFDVLPKTEAADPDYQPIGDCRDFTVGLEPKPNHPSPKPLNVMEWFVSSVPGDIILDPFGGSGTTGVAAKKLGKHFLLFENDATYIDEARERIAAVQPNLFAPQAEQMTLESQ